jgi:shikimate kinase
MTGVSKGTPVVVLIGAPGAGKSRIGKRVARLLDVPFVDTDKRIVAAHGSIADIFARDGEPHFRELERLAVEAALTEHAVVSLGGGAVLDPRTQADLEGLAVVELRVEPHAVERRIQGPKRPLLAGGIDSWKALVAARQPIYTRLAGITIDTTAVPVERIAAQIADWTRTHASRSTPVD